MLNLARLADPQLAEQELTNGLIKLDTVGDQKLYFLAGHGEIAARARRSRAKRRAAPRGSAASACWKTRATRPTALNLIEGGEMPKDASAVVIAGARSKLPETEEKVLERYLDQGGRLLFFAEAEVETGLERAAGEVRARRSSRASSPTPR